MNQGQQHSISSEAASWSSNKEYVWGNNGQRPALKVAMRVTAPMDYYHDMRAVMCDRIEDIMGEGRAEVHHHEVASGQLEIGVSFNTLLKRPMRFSNLSMWCKMLLINLVKQQPLCQNRLLVIMVLHACTYFHLKRGCEYFFWR